MAIKKRGISAELLIHPGETISDLLEDRDLTQKELAQRANVSEAFLSDVIHGKKDISKGLAKGLEYALDIPSSFWLNLQANYDAELLEVQEEESIQADEKDALKHLKEIIKYLQYRKMLKEDITETQLILDLRRRFRVSSLSGLPMLVPNEAFRMSDTSKIDPYVMGAWLCICKERQSTQEIPVTFDITQKDELIQGIKTIMCTVRGDPQKALCSILKKHGIDFSIVHNFRGAPVHGYISRKDDGSYQMVLTIRGAYADIFWFSLFHELGHIVNGDLSKPGNYIDADYSKDNPREKAADKFAGDSLLNPIEYRKFIDNGSFSYVSIEEFSRKQAVPPYVVIGRLQKEKIIPYARFSKYKPKFAWAE